MDISSLNTLLEGEEPFGIYLKNEKKIYRALRSRLNRSLGAYRALSETQESLQDETLQDNNSAVWKELNDATYEILTETSKDIEIFCWFIASCAQEKNPFEKLREALDTLVLMLEENFHSLQPISPTELPDDKKTQIREQVDLKLRPFIQLFGEVEKSGLIYSPLSNLEIFDGIVLARFAGATRDGTLGEMKQVFAEYASGSGSNVTSTYELLRATEKVLVKLSDKLNSVAFENGLTPPNRAFILSPVKDLLDMIETLAEGTGLKLVRVEETILPGEDEDTLKTVEDNSGVSAENSSEKKPETEHLGRDNAILMMAELADFFRKTEPHSPVHLLLERAVRWSQLSFRDLFAELLTEDSTAFAGLSTTSGMESEGFSKTLLKTQSKTAGFQLRNFSQFQNLLEVPLAADKGSENSPARNSEPMTIKMPDEMPVLAPLGEAPADEPVLANVEANVEQKDEQDQTSSLDGMSW